MARQDFSQTPGETTGLQPQVEPQRHVRCVPGDVAPHVLLPGDPGRAQRIAAGLPEARLVAQNREFVVYTGRTRAGTPVSVCSTGIGGPSASIALEELARVGGTCFIRVGSAGGRQPGVAIGSLVIATAAYRADGTSRAYVPPEFPAVADLGITLALARAARRLGYAFHHGIVFSRDAFYRQDPGLNRQLTEAGVVASEQECATLFVVGAVRGVRVGAILATDSNILLERQPPAAERERLFRRAEAQMIDVALAAVDDLAQGSEPW